MKKETPFIVGIDLDNTIINYEEQFFLGALTAGYISPDFIKDKKSIRDRIRFLKNGEVKWQDLQAKVYGKNIIDAKLYDGVKEVFQLCRQLNITIYIISHKTKHPAADKNVNLRESAMLFLEDKGFFSEKLITPGKIFFESTRKEKIARINKLNCDLFIDDLVEIFKEPFLSEHATKILFDNNKTHSSSEDIKVVHSWGEISDFLVEMDDFSKIKDLLKAHHNLDDTIQIDIMATRINQGKNSRAYHVEYGLTSFIAKFYLNDQKDRMKREISALSFLGTNNFKNVPALFCSDFKNGCSLLQFIKGNNIESIKVGYKEIDSLISFIKQLKSIGKNSNGIMTAADAVLSPKKNIEIIDSRLEKFTKEEGSQLSSDLFEFLNNYLKPYWKIIKNNIIIGSKTDQISFHSELNIKNQILSPSDFGFHNTVMTKNKKIYFIDFEYFGWDDPVKLILDFILHPGMEINLSLKKYYFKEMTLLFSDDKTIKDRIRMYLPALIVKWILIILNEFVPEYYNQRRLDNNFKKEHKHTQIVQLEKAVKIFNGKEMLIQSIEEWLEEI